MEILDLIMSIDSQLFCFELVNVNDFGNTLENIKFLPIFSEKPDFIYDKSRISATWKHKILSLESKILKDWSCSVTMYYNFPSILSNDSDFRLSNTYFVF